MNIFYKILFGVIFLLALAIGFYWYMNDSRQEKPQNNNGNNIVDWVTYKNTDFGFTIKHPKTWQVHKAPDDLITPKFNIYKSGSDESLLPYTHHTPDITHVSIFPQGIPTEGVSGESKQSSISFSVPIEESRDFLLSNGEPWATFANINNVHSNWNQYGFLFAQTKIQNHRTECFRGDELIQLQQCDPLMGDRIVHYGSINTSDRAIQEKILASFEFE